MRNEKRLRDCSRQQINTAVYVALVAFRIRFSFFFIVEMMVPPANQHHTLENCSEFWAPASLLHFHSTQPPSYWNIAIECEQFINHINTPISSPEYQWLHPEAYKIIAASRYHIQGRSQDFFLVVVEVGRELGWEVIHCAQNNHSKATVRCLKSFL